MQIFHNLNEWIRFRNSLSPDLSLGFAPTMGNLHAGHASLFLASSKENHYTVSSLFVNPTQFNNPDDYTYYPRTVDADLELMTQNGVDFCILPNENEIYADGYAYQVQENRLGQLMEGKHRPGHFNGVLTIVMKLFNLVKPTCAYFGEKDYQQLLLIQGMVKALFMDIEIKSCPTVREKSGLACSSRNNRLTPSQREIADEFAKIFHQNKSSAMISKELEALGITVEYIEEFQGRRFAAVKIGDIRLIDNYLL
ncbi:pantoate--beta-alanine ligase [Legionella pneumophila]|uniref:pantoate--beta-alanine ligase n=1 Tax=Legionella pneumophila TaxID=446 RepID=UPI001374E9AC|nr:pantoate--beta-alanine ligase [Legionella pneumophila]HAT8815165.1 pantoate--beta-alanine ligase [Legionella pneumophila subsp. pneumophila]MCZ4805015.1 pantoate--beta-alanine ligase [Legionella pneumophila]MDW9178107.1 pantoate--beta-alanine ligase [Legionella pneumophila]HAT1823604.1 pantoate--beta-alanine ligase [Legionella pneumophila]HAT1863785.1 pantoate--beta-alanine ligase [Legionella pneumophila]